MEVSLEPGKYIVAVSGGVDSVALLYLLKSQKNLDLAVAHFDHGIREDSFKDCDFVAKLSDEYNLPFFQHRVNWVQMLARRWPEKLVINSWKR